MIDENNFYEFSLYSLESITDELLREKVLQMHYNEIEKIYKNHPEYIDYSKSVLEAVYTVDYLEESLKSSYIAPGERLKYYLIQKEKRSLKERLCLVSGAVINKGSRYKSYKVFITSLDSDKRFVSQEFVTEAYTDFVFPESLAAFENMLISLECSYENDFDDLYSIYTSNRGNIRLRGLK